MRGLGYVNVVALNQDSGILYASEIKSNSKLNSGMLLQTLLRDNAMLKFAPSEKVGVTNSIYSLPPNSIHQDWIDDNFFVTYYIDRVLEINAKPHKKCNTTFK